MAFAEARRRFPAYSEEQAALVAAMLLEDAAQNMHSPQPRATGKHMPPQGTATGGSSRPKATGGREI
jgi:hypothetical protein